MYVAGLSLKDRIQANKKNVIFLNRKFPEKESDVIIIQLCQ